MAQIKVKKDNDEKVLCPCCREELNELIEKELRGKWDIITSKRVYACNKCQKVIPVAHSTHV